MSLSAYRSRREVGYWSRWRIVWQYRWRTLGLGQPQQFYSGFRGQHCPASIGYRWWDTALLRVVGEPDETLSPLALSTVVLRRFIANDIRLAAPALAWAEPYEIQDKVVTSHGSTRLL